MLIVSIVAVTVTVTVTFSSQMLNNDPYVINGLLGFPVAFN